jgi:hypothetical protein
MKSGDVITCNVTISGAGLVKATDYTILDTFYYVDPTIPKIQATSQQKGLLMLVVENGNGAKTVVPSTQFTSKDAGLNI